MYGLDWSGSEKTESVFELWHVREKGISVIISKTNHIGQRLGFY